MLATQHLKAAAAITLATSAVAVPAASAHGPPAEQTCAGCYSPAAESTIVHVDSNSGFDWLDAGIGAAGGIAISIAAVGGVLTVSQRRAQGAQIDHGPQLTRNSDASWPTPMTVRSARGLRVNLSATPGQQRSARPAGPAVGLVAIALVAIALTIVIRERATKPSHRCPRPPV